MVKYLQKKYALSTQGAKDLIQGVIASFVQNLSFLFPMSLLLLLIKNLLDGVTPISQILLYGIGIVVCLVILIFAAYWQYVATYYATYVESGVRRIAIAEQLRKLPLAYFNKKDLADLTTTIMADSSTIESVFSHFIPGLFASIASTTLIGLSLLFINWQMALAALWVLPISFGVVFLSKRVQASFSAKAMDAKLACADRIQECIEVSRDLKANNAESIYLVGLDTKIKHVEKRAVMSEFGLATFVVSSSLFLKVGIATVVVVGTLLLIQGSIDIFTFFMFVLVASRIYDPLQVSLEHLAAIIATQKNIDRMNEILEYPIQNGSQQLTNQGVDIEFKDVCFSYNPGKMVLNGVSFQAKQGEVTALIGPSGGGKTTVARLASRFWDVNSGNIKIGGMDVSTIDPETLFSLFSIVFQEVVLFNNTVMENIRIGNKDATDEEVLQAAKMANCDEFVRKLPNGYQSDIGENGCELSGGERQRISIARAFLKNAPIILLDEATASLDVDNETLIQAALSKLIQGKTVLVIAHRMRTVIGVDKIVVLEKGIVAESGTPKELMQQAGIFKKMVEMQNQSQDWIL